MNMILLPTVSKPMWYMFRGKLKYVSTDGMK